MLRAVTDLIVRVFLSEKTILLATHLARQPIEKNGNPTTQSDCTLLRRVKRGEQPAHKVYGWAKQQYSAMEACPPPILVADCVGYQPGKKNLNPK